MPGGKSYYLTTAIYYVNDVPHLGHAYDGDFDATCWPASSASTAMT